MKKLKIRGKEIKKLGINDDQIISMAINLISTNFKSNNKTEAFERLGLIINNPEGYTNDTIFGTIARLLANPKKEKKSKRDKNVILVNKDSAKLYKIYGRQGIDEGTISQMDMAMSLPISIEGALMADAHQGYGLPIGGVLKTYNSVIPYAVGMDIGCRMCLSIYPINPGFIIKENTLLKKILIENTRFGRAEFNDIKGHEIIDRNEFLEIKFLRGLKEKTFHQLGTSGGGNHFVDIGIIVIPEDIFELSLQKGEYVAILSHSGSRGMGAEIARHYTGIAKEKRQLSKGAANLAWLEIHEEEGIEYWKSMNLAGDYSSANHHIIHTKLSKAIGEDPIAMVENHHNFAWKDQINKKESFFIHRKGATPANKGDLGIIPGSMATPAFLVKGKGNGESLNSASHGAGRVLSRSQAKSEIQKKTLLQFMKNKGIELIGGDTDEAPVAYKDIYKIMQYQKDLVEELGIFHPKIVRMCGSTE